MVTLNQVAMTTQYVEHKWEPNFGSERAHTHTYMSSVVSTAALHKVSSIEAVKFIYK